MKTIKRYSAMIALGIIFLLPKFFWIIIPKKYHDIPGKLYGYTETGEWK